MTEEQGSATRDEEQQDQPQDTEGSPKAEGDDQEASGADSAADQEAKGGGDSGDSESGGDKTEAEAESDEAKEEIKRLEEEGPPEDLEDWPTGKAKYETFGGPEGEHSYSEGPEEKMGPADVRHREDGSVEVHGEEVDDPKEFKGKPIEGGPTDPDTPNLRMDSASPDDVSDVAKEAMEERSSGEDEESSGDDDEDSAGGGEE
jgi:hypothetical protein